MWEPLGKVYITEHFLKATKKAGEHLAQPTFSIIHIMKLMMASPSLHTINYFSEALLIRSVVITIFVKRIRTL